MKKIYRILALALMMTLLLGSLSACGGEKAKTVESVDFAALSKEVLDAGVFDDILNTLPGETAVMLYELDADDVAECTVYCSTGATAEEIALFKATDEAAAGRIKTAVETRIDHQKQAFESYVPAEVPKLEDAVVLTNGLFVAFVTSKDSAAVKTILAKYM